MFAPSGPPPPHLTLVWDIFVDRVRAPESGRAPDEPRIATTLPRAEICLRALTEIGGADPWS